MKVKLKIFSLFLIFIHSYTDPLFWNMDSEFLTRQFHLESDPTRTIKLTLKDVPLVQLDEKIPKYQVFRKDQLVDFSEFARIGYNLKLRLNEFSEKPLAYHDNFLTFPEFSREYRFLSDLTYKQCKSTCDRYDARLPDSYREISEIHTFRPQIVDYFWIEAVQTVNFDKQNHKYNYNITFDNDNLFPKTNHSVEIYHYLHGKYNVIPPNRLRSRSEYYNYISNTYSKLTPYHLEVRYSHKRFGFSKSFQKITKTRNSTWISRGAGNSKDITKYFHILIPISKNFYQPAFSKSTCICSRDKSKNLKQARLAAEIAQATLISLENAPSKIEMDRLSSSNVSNPSIYKITNQSHYRPSHSNDILTRSHISPLSLAGGFERQPIRSRHLHQEDFSTIAGEEDLNNPIRSDFYLGRRRAGRAAPLMLGALSKFFLSQTVAVTAPYLVSQAEKIFQKLAAKSTLQFRAHFKKSNTSFQQQLDDTLRDSPANLKLLHDKVELFLKDSTLENESEIESFVPNPQNARRLQRKALRLTYFTDKLYHNLPRMLLDKVQSQLPIPPLPNSTVYAEIKTSHSFFIISYFFQCQVDAFSSTHTVIKSLPHLRQNKNFFNLQIPTQSLNFDPRIDQSLPTLQADNCAKAALSQDNTPLQKLCNTTLFSAQIISEIFDLQNGKLYLFLGKSTLFLSCYHRASQVLNIDNTFSLFYINHGCSFRLQYKSLLRYKKATVDLLIGIDFRRLLDIDVPIRDVLESFHSVWLISLSVGLSLLFLFIFLICLICCLIKKKFKPKIAFSDNGDVELSVLPSQPAESSVDITIDDAQPTTKATGKPGKPVIH